MYPGTGPVRAATDCFGFPKSFYKTLYEFPLSKVESLISGTFCGHTSVSTEQDSAEGEKESNGSAADKQESAQDVDEDSCPAMEPESTVDSSHPENQEEMEVSGEENSEKGQNPEKKQMVSARLVYFDSVSLQTQLYSASVTL